MSYSTRPDRERIKPSRILMRSGLIADFSTQGLPDSYKTLIPTLHNFIYDVYFFGADMNIPQSLEFDMNQFTSGRSYIFGHECPIAEGHGLGRLGQSQQIGRRILVSLVIP